MVEWPAAWRGHSALALTSDLARVVMLPEAGAKIASLIVAGREMLWRNPHIPIRGASYGDRYRDYGASGIDFCFPTIAPCTLAHLPGHRMEVPDHGEVWTLPWEVEVLAEGVRLCTTGRCWPYRLCTEVSLAGSSLTIRAHLENLGDDWFPYQWALHPAFPLTDETRLTWPGTGLVEVDDRLLNLRTPGLTSLGFVAKVFVGPLSQGAATLSQEYGRVHLQWDAQALPYLGVWISHEDETQPGGRCCLAVEPSAAPDDSLAAAHAAGQAPIIGPRQAREWQVRLAFES